MKRGLFTGSLVAGLSLCMQAQAAWLQICPASNTAEPGRPQAQITRHENTALLASITDTPASAGCQQLELVVPASDVVGLLPITARLSAELVPWLSLSGKTQGSRFLFGEVTSGKPAPTHALAPQPFPLRTNLLGSLNATPFGAEKRTRVTLANGQLSLQCTPGRQPAGLVLSANAYLPRARTRLQISGSGSGRFEIVTVNAEQAAIESGSRLGYFEAQGLARTQTYDLSTRPVWQDWRHWTLACPADSAQLQLNRLELLPQTVTTPARAAWVWQAGEWQHQPDSVLRLAKKYALRTLYITIPVVAGAVQNPERLAAFIRRAGAANIGVWAVDGDPNMVQLQERPATLERARAYARFNRTMPLGARLKGVQFDVEPYLLTGYELATDAWEQRYVELVKALHGGDPDIAQGTLALEMVVPFWWAGKPGLLDAMAPWVTGLVVMDYVYPEVETSNSNVIFYNHLALVGYLLFVMYISERMVKYDIIQGLVSILNINFLFYFYFAIKEFVQFKLFNIYYSIVRTYRVQEDVRALHLARATDPSELGLSGYLLVLHPTPPHPTLFHRIALN